MKKLKDAIKLLNAWVHRHPYQAILFTVALMITDDFISRYDGGFFYWMAVLWILVILWAALFLKDVRKTLLVLALVMGISLPAKAPEPPPVQGPVGYTVGAVLLCVGIYCTVRLVKFCQRKLPRTPPPPTNQVENVFGIGDDEYGASWNFGSLGTCDPTLGDPGGPDFVALDVPATLFIIDITPDGTMTTKALVGDEFTQSWTDFQMEVASHGLTITGSADGSQYFSCNRVPCAGNDITFDELTKTVAIGDGERLIEIERSRDLLFWSPFLKARVASGSRGLRIEDATTSASMFYRVTIADAP